MPQPLKNTAIHSRRVLATAVIAGLVVLGLCLVCYGQCTVAEGAASAERVSYLGWCCIGGGLGGLGLWIFTRRLL